MHPPAPFAHEPGAGLDRDARLEGISALARFEEPRSGGRARTRRCRRRAWLLEGARRAVADHTRATLLGTQDRQRPQQTAEEPPAESQAGITGDLDGGDEQG